MPATIGTEFAMYTVIKILTVAVLIIAGLLYYPYLNPENIAAFIEDNHIAAPVIFIIVCAVRPVLFFLPSMGLTIVAGILFGAAWGTVYVAVGGAFSTAVGYFFARWLGRDLIRKMTRLSKSLSRLDEWAGQHGRNAVLSMRLFNMPWDVVSYWAGLAGIDFRQFYAASMIPLIPISFLYTYFGSRVFQPESAGFIVSLSIMFLLGAVPYIRWRWKKRAYG
jgi:uncharacterized membrane protein YdjX (TVP38/TMEM64 family)